MRGPTAFLHFLFPAVYGVISLPRSSIFFSVRLGWDTVGPPLLPLPASFWEAPPATFSYEDNADSPTYLPIHSLARAGLLLFRIFLLPT